MLAHDVVGTGPPLVLLHFLGGHRNVWRPVLPRLAEHHQVFSLDLPGFGDSSPLPGSPTLPRLADAVLETIDGLGLERPAVAGISIGGGLAVELAARERDGRPVVSSSVAISPVGFTSRAESAFAKASLRATHAACRALVGQIDRLSGPRALRTAFGAQIFAKPWQVPAPDLAALVRSVAESPGTLPTLRAAVGHQIPGGAITTPLTIAWGQRDALLLPRQGARAIERLPFAHLVPLRGCGHVPLWDDTELVGDVILRGSRAAA
ncbi:MAG: alpha/beta fold hydrolase [Patulibacter sp.]